MLTSRFSNNSPGSNELPAARLFTLMSLITINVTYVQYSCLVYSELYNVYFLIHVILDESNYLWINGSVYVTHMTFTYAILY